METKQGTIKSIEVSKGTSDKGEWTKYLFKMTDEKKYSTFDAVIGKAFEAGDTVEFTGEQSGKYWNLKSMHKIEAIDKTPIQPQDFGKQDQYDKDPVGLAVETCIALIQGKVWNTAEACMKDAILRVKQARDAFS